MGARPMARVIQENLKKPMANELLFGDLVDGGTVRVKLKKDELVFEFTSETGSGSLINQFYCY